MTGFEKLSMRKLSRDTASVLRAIKETQTSMVITRYGEPVALLTPSSIELIEQIGRTAPQTFARPKPNRRSKRVLTDATGIGSGELSILLARCEMKGAIVKKPWGYSPRNPIRR